MSVQPTASSIPARALRRIGRAVGRPLFGRSVYDREILQTAALSLGSLATQPLYLLVDTAIVGRLGRPQLAALAAAGITLAFVYAMFNFLTYATTAQVGRAEGAGETREARALAAQALWLSVAFGVAVGVVLFAAAPSIAAMMSLRGEAASYAETYLRISAPALPFMFVGFAGLGILRGLASLRGPLVIIASANLLNVVLELLFVFELDWGISGAAWSTAISEVLMGLGLLVLSLAAIQWRVGIDLSLAGRLLGIGRHIFVRTTVLYGAILVAGVVVARFGEASISAHRIAFQLWVFVAVILDSVAIAAQVIVGRMLGAGDADGARRASARMIGITVAFGAVFAGLLVAGEGPIVALFTADATVVEKTHDVWLMFAAALPLSAAVYALDGILIGASDARFLMWAVIASAIASTLVAAAALHYEWGIVGVWSALLVLNGFRLITLTLRFARGPWAVVGWSH